MTKEKEVFEATTKATQLGSMIKALVNGKPSDFQNYYKKLMNIQVDKDMESLKAAQKKQAFKHKPEEVDAEDILNMKEPTKNPPPAVEEPEKSEDEQLADMEKDILKKYYKGMSDAIESMREPRESGDSQHKKMDIEK